MPTSFKEIGTLKTKGKTLGWCPSQCRGAEEGSSVSWARMGSTTEGDLKRKLMADGIDEGGGMACTQPLCEGGVSMTPQAKKSSNNDWVEWIKRDSNLCMRNRSDCGGGRKRKRIRKTLVSKCIDHFRPTCQVYVKDKRIYFFYHLGCCLWVSSYAHGPEWHKKMCPTDFMLVTHGQIMYVVIFSLVIDWQI
jgi:hypothetical protein